MSNIKRTIIKDLLTWKEEQFRVPLILKGARQTGKTFLINQFSAHFPSFFEFNFQKDKLIHPFFEDTNDPEILLKKLSIYVQKTININQDLIFFDEIQDSPAALNSLKFFAEKYPNAFIVAAGSLLGTYLSNFSFPVGKVKFLTLYPLSFFEYLAAKKQNELVSHLTSLNFDNMESVKFINSFHSSLLEDLKEFFIVGGMPKVVSTYLESHDFLKVREVQGDLLTSYKADFAKYSGPADAVKILNVFESIPKQLAKDNRKFQFKTVKNKARYSDFSLAIDWLVTTGIAYKIPILDHAEIPLKAYVSDHVFKLYFLDVGLLAALSELPINAFLQNEQLFKTFKGAFTENFFMQEFYANRNESLYSWSGKTSEIDFLFQDNREMNLFPIEVKSGESGKLKSLNVFYDKYAPRWKTRCDLRPIEINHQSAFRNIPLYLASRV